MQHGQPPSPLTHFTYWKFTMFSTQSLLFLSSSLSPPLPFAMGREEVRFISFSFHFKKRLCNVSIRKLPVNECVERVEKVTSYLAVKGKADENLLLKFNRRDKTRERPLS